jgi:DNA-binding NtrC family response regulator
MKLPLLFPQPGRNRALLVSDDPMAGAALQEELLAQGADVFWARDSIEARWLWVPNFYASVIISLEKDSTGAEGLIRRIRTDDPEQHISVVNSVQDVSGVKKPVRSIPAPKTHESLHEAKNKGGKLLHMPKRKSQ